MEPSAEAGPSRPSPRRMTPPPVDATSTDIVMEDVSASAPIEGGEPDDAVALLLNISSAVDVPPPLPPKPESMEVIMEDQTREVAKPAPPDNPHTYPYTPPDEKDHNNNDRPPDSVEQQTESSVFPLSASLPNGLPSHTQGSSPSAHPPTPIRTSPDPPVKPKGKRKRNANAGSSRRASSDHPAHWLGEDNTIIRCICGFTEDDGFTIQCEGCGAWEHGMCFGYMDEASAPDQYFCELCKPRPFDAAAAKRMQIIMQDSQRQAREAASTGGDPSVEKEKEKPRSKSGKPKRARTESVLDGELDKDKDSGKEHSPGVMGPPAVKPKRRQPGPKPRAKQPITPSATAESSSAPVPSFKEQQQPPLEEPEDDYFRIEPWTLEYTPIKENIVRGVAARQIMRKLYKEWVDAEEEVVAAKSRAVHNPSGLPSPTETGILRLSPDNLFPPPDFHILAPPVPPIFLSGSSLESLSSPVSIQIVEDAPSFLPLTYAENISSYGVYTRPTIYSVFAEEPITLGSFVGEFKGEVLDCETYRKDPINQYSCLGVPKPHVRSIGPPVNLIIDARGYGNDLRFVRSGCHPNVVLRPLLWRSSESESLKLKFGLFAAKDIGKKDELVLGWEWDDQHVVHSLRSIVHAAMLNDGSLASPSFSTSIRTVNQLSHKIDSVLTHIFGTFTACACVVPGQCALAQMGQLVEPKVMQDHHIHENPRKKLRADLGELVGAVRGWRRRELESAQMRQWRLTQDRFDLGLSRMSSRSSQAEVYAHSAESRSQSEDPVEDQSSTRADESMEQDTLVEEASNEEHAAPKQMIEKPAIPEIPVDEGLLREDEAMDVEESAPVAEETQAQDIINIPAVDFVPPSIPSPKTSPAVTINPIPEVAMIPEPAAESAQPETPIASPKPHSTSPRKAKVERQDSSSSLSSAVSSIKPSSAADDLDSGSESDATTATIPKSHFSEESDGESAIMDDDEEGLPTQSSPVKPPSNGSRKVRRVLSPVIESSNYMNGHIEIGGNHEISEDEREMVIKKPKKSLKAKVIPDSSPKSTSKSVRKITLITSPTNSLSSRGVPPPKSKKGRIKRIVSSSSASGDDQYDRQDTTSSPSGKQKKVQKNSRDIEFSPISAKSVKLEKLEDIPQINGEARAIVPDQVVAPLSVAMEVDEAAIPDPEIVAPIESQPAPDTLAGVDGTTEITPAVEAKETTPSPKEPTPPPKEPTPPPEPPKKVSISDYLKSHKFRKEAQTPISEVPLANPASEPPKVELTPKAVEAKLSSSFDDIPGFGNIGSSTTNSSSPVKGEPETPTLGGKLNLSEYLPSNRITSVNSTPTSGNIGLGTPAIETPRTSSYVPRSTSNGSAPGITSTDYFPTQPQPQSQSQSGGSSAFVPRSTSMSYTPRPSVPDDSSSLGLGLNTSGYQSQDTIGLGKSPSDMIPPPLPIREIPPHTTTTPVVGGIARPPPTGPKVPPTGPRGGGVSGTPTRGGEIPPTIGSGYRGSPVGRGFGGRGLWRGGRGGFRGGWRGT
ncbi:uncharacterized protein I206_101374 [Kwoniella pini CBS 10737]|uniref:SET domain-containing protein n=1 Tax=Kwoniella pini CBS 10737 TaxID=1296096 RepID=A0A1B9HWV8_9TREE|nr:uncharacterized protein I206_06656 [Kwoniella pini CBS 10737]OCF47750.1 hypothetical protein I206_06656 [Kwoniella pini CBS 10737]